MWDLGWTETGKFKWKHTGLHKVLDLQEGLDDDSDRIETDAETSSGDDSATEAKRRKTRKKRNTQRKQLKERRKNKNAHEVRESWRFLEFELWKQSEDRTQPIRAGAKYGEKAITLVRNHFEEEDGTGRAIMSGACMSPAAVAEKFPKGCCWPGCQELGTHEHVCNKRPEDAPPRPSCGMRAGWGWGMSGVSKTLPWMKQAAEQIWLCRSGSKRRDAMAAHPKEEEDEEDSELEWEADEYDDSTVMWGEISGGPANYAASAATTAGTSAPPVFY